MIKEFIFTGRTIDDAISAGCAELHADRDEVSVEVLETPSRSFLGLKVTPAKVKISIETPDEPKKVQMPKTEQAKPDQVRNQVPVPQVSQPAKPNVQPQQNRQPQNQQLPQTAKPQQMPKQPQPQAPKQPQPQPQVKREAPKPEPKPQREPVAVSEEDTKKASENVTAFLTEIMGIMETGAAVNTTSENGVINTELKGSNMGIIIGRRGETLDALQYLSSLIANKGHEEYIKVNLDTENYREKRAASLTSLAQKVAAKVEKNKKSVALEPMNPYERRIIHSVLQDNANVVTVSVGIEPNRKVVVHPAGMQPQKNQQGRYNNRNRRPHRPNNSPTNQASNQPSNPAPETEHAE